MAAYGSESGRSYDALQTAASDPIRTLARLTPIKTTTNLSLHFRLFCSLLVSIEGNYVGRSEK